MTLDDFLTFTLPERIVWLHSAEGPKGKLSHDRFAAILGTSRQVVITWEKPGGPEPTVRLRKALAEFSGFPVAAFSRREAEVLAAPTTGSRLGSVEAELRWLRTQLLRCLAALELDPQAEAPSAQSADALP